jgi:hypothetical protein
MGGTFSKLFDNFGSDADIRSRILVTHPSVRYSPDLINCKIVN